MRLELIFHPALVREPRPLEGMFPPSGAALSLLFLFFHPGTEAGGHGGSTTPSTFVLVSEILATLARDGAPPVLAAGGLATGTQIAPYLTLGATGAALGTRFLLTSESPYKPAQKAALLAARSHGATARTLAFDLARDTAYWPGHINGRGLRNAIVDDLEAGVDLGTVQARFREAAEVGDASYMVVFAGQGVGLMNEIKPIKVSGRVLCCERLPSRFPALWRSLLLSRLSSHRDFLTYACWTGRDGRAAHGSREAVAEVTAAIARVLKLRDRPTHPTALHPHPCLIQ